MKFQEKWIDLHVAQSKFYNNNMLQPPSVQEGSKTMFSKLFGSKIRAPSSFEASPGGAAENGHDGGKVTCCH